MKIFELYEGFIPFTREIEDSYPLDEFILKENGDNIILDVMVVHKGSRKSGVGSDVMGKLIEYADSNNKTMVLDLLDKNSEYGTTSKNRLVKFYKRFGFVENKGRNKNPKINYMMYREPSNG